MPLCPGVAPSYHRWWSVRVVAPAAGEPQGWYTEFVQRWRAYLELLAQPRGSQPLADVSAEQVARVRPREECSSLQDVCPGVGAAGSADRGRKGTGGVDTVEQVAKRRRRTAPQPPPKEGKKRGRDARQSSTTPPQKRRRSATGSQAALEEVQAVPVQQPSTARAGRGHGRAQQGPPT